MSLVFLSLSSPWQWKTVTPILRVPRRQNTAVWLSHFSGIEHPACQHILHSLLPTALLFLFLPLFPSTHLLLPHPLSFPLPSLTVSEDGSDKDKGQTKSQHFCEHLFYIAAHSLWCSILRLSSLWASGECHCELLCDMLQDFQNTLVELKIQHMLQTALCDDTMSRHSLSLGRGAHTWHGRQAVYWYNSLLR